MLLDREMETYWRELPRLLPGHEGEFVLIHGDEVDSLWPTEDEGYDAGVARFGPQPFLVRRVQKDDPIIPLFVDVNP